MTARRGSRLHSRLRAGVRNGSVEAIGPKSLRLVLRELLFDGQDIPDWRRAAACQNTNPEIFFPPQGWAGPTVTDTAKRVCAGCPVRSSCLADALAWERPSERYGVLGGLTGTERGELAERLSQVAAGSAGGASA